MGYWDEYDDLYGFGSEDELTQALEFKKKKQEEYAAPDPANIPLPPKDDSTYFDDDEDFWGQQQQQAVEFKQQKQERSHEQYMMDLQNEQEAQQANLQEYDAIGALTNQALAFQEQQRQDAAAQAAKDAQFNFAQDWADMMGATDYDAYRGDYIQPDAFEGQQWDSFDTVSPDTVSPYSMEEYIDRYGRPPMGGRPDEATVRSLIPEGNVWSYKLGGHDVGDFPVFDSTDNNAFVNTFSGGAWDDLSEDIQQGITDVATTFYNESYKRDNDLYTGMDKKMYLGNDLFAEGDGDFALSDSYVALQNGLLSVGENFEDKAEKEEWLLGKARQVGEDFESWDDLLAAYGSDKVENKKHLELIMEHLIIGSALMQFGEFSKKGTSAEVGDNITFATLMQQAYDENHSDTLGTYGDAKHAGFMSEADVALARKQTENEATGGLTVTAAGIPAAQQAQALESTSVFYFKNDDGSFGQLAIPNTSSDKTSSKTIFENYAWSSNPDAKAGGPLGTLDGSEIIFNIGSVGNKGIANAQFEFEPVLPDDVAAQIGMLRESGAYDQAEQIRLSYLEEAEAAARKAHEDTYGTQDYLTDITFEVNVGVGGTDTGTAEVDALDILQFKWNTTKEGGGYKGNDLRHNNIVIQPTTGEDSAYYEAALDAVIEQASHLLGVDASGIGENSSEADKEQVVKNIVGVWINSTAKDYQHPIAFMHDLAKINIYDPTTGDLLADSFDSLPQLEQHGVTTGEEGEVTEADPQVDPQAESEVQDGGESGVLGNYGVASAFSADGSSEVAVEDPSASVEAGVAADGMYFYDQVTSDGEDLRIPFLQQAGYYDPSITAEEREIRKVAAAKAWAQERNAYALGVVETKFNADDEEMFYMRRGYEGDPTRDDWGHGGWMTEAQIDYGLMMSGADPSIMSLADKIQAYNNADPQYEGDYMAAGGWTDGGGDYDTGGDSFNTQNVFDEIGNAADGFFTDTKNFYDQYLSEDGPMKAAGKQYNNIYKALMPFLTTEDAGSLWTLLQQAGDTAGATMPDEQTYEDAAEFMTKARFEQIENALNQVETTGVPAEAMKWLKQWVIALKDWAVDPELGELWMSSEKRAALTHRLGNLWQQAASATRWGGAVMGIASKMALPYQASGYDKLYFGDTKPNPGW